MERLHCIVHKLCLNVFNDVLPSNVTPLTVYLVSTGVIVTLKDMNMGIIERFERNSQSRLAKQNSGLVRAWEHVSTKGSCRRHVRCYAANRRRTCHMDRAWRLRATTGYELLFSPIRLTKRLCLTREKGSFDDDVEEDEAIAVVEVGNGSAFKSLEGHFPSFRWSPEHRLLLEFAVWHVVLPYARRADTSMPSDTASSVLSQICLAGLNFPLGLRGCQCQETRGLYFLSVECSPAVVARFVSCDT